LGVKKPTWFEDVASVFGEGHYDHMMVAGMELQGLQ